MNAGPLDDLERGGESAHCLEVRDCRKKLGRGIGVSTDVGEFFPGALSRGQRTLRRALQFVDDGKSAVELRGRARLAVQSPCLRHLLPRQRSGGELPAQFGALPEPVQKRQPSVLVVRGPELEGATAPLERVAIGMGGVKVLRRGEQRQPGPRRLLCRRPVLREHRRPSATLLQQLGKPPVKQATPAPRDVEIERLAREGVAERRDARLDFDQDAE
jgi:hypothetical protein